MKMYTLETIRSYRQGRKDKWQFQEENREHQERYIIFSSKTYLCHRKKWNRYDFMLTSIQWFVF